MKNNAEAKPGYKLTPLGWIPEEWEVKSLRSFCSTYSGGTPSRTEPNYYGGPIPWIKSGELNQGLVTTTEETITEHGLKNSSAKVIEKNTLLLALYGATAGIPAISKIKAAINQAILAIIVDENTSLYVFLYYWFSINRENIIKTYCQGGQPNLNAEIINGVQIPLPPLAEQQAIAHVISTWDRAIEKLQLLIENLELRKKWLMQQLLTGKKRLPGFSGEWREVRLGDLGTTYSGLSGKQKEDFGTGKPYIPYLNVFKNYIIDKTQLDYVQINANERQNKVQYGDILFTVSSETQDEVGMASVLLCEFDELYLNSFCFGFRLNNFKMLLPEFSCFLFRSTSFRELILKLSQGATRFNLSKNNLMKLSVNLPDTIEQMEIAKTLNNCQNEIKLLNQKLEELQQQKKGLMQVLLTGKKRVV